MLAKLPDASIFLTRKEDRRQNALLPNFRSHIRTIAARGRCLEIGPSVAPILPKARGFDVTVVDHLSAEDLRAKYGGRGIDLSEIEAVDCIWNDGRLSDLLPGRFDTIVAAHVVEHMTDLVKFLDDCDRLLEDDGRLALIVPDKRYCFDLFQPVSDAAKVVGDHVRGAQRHSFDSLYRNSANVAVKDREKYTISWGQRDVSELHFMDGDPDKHFARAREQAAGDAYVDSHEYYFTPSTFMAVIGELSYLGLTRFAFETLTRARGSEFLAILRKGHGLEKPSLGDFLENKKALMLNYLREEAEAVDQQLRSGWRGFRLLRAVRSRA